MDHGTARDAAGGAESERAGPRDLYAEKALAQIPRLLSLEDRSEFSSTYGCFDREYWLCRSTDFPSATAQIGVLSLALVFSTPFPNNPHHRNPKILLWTLAGMDYWMRIQKRDGSFDGFYPNERGWAGPTGLIIEDEISLRRGVRLSRVRLGDEFQARYAPQSRYFQPQELGMRGSYLTRKDLETLNGEGSFRLARRIDYHEGLLGYGREGSP